MRAAASRGFTVVLIKEHVPFFRQKSMLLGVPVPTGLQRVGITANRHSLSAQTTSTRPSTDPATSLILPKFVLMANFAALVMKDVVNPKQLAIVLTVTCPVIIPDFLVQMPVLLLSRLTGTRVI